MSCEHVRQDSTTFIYEIHKGLPYLQVIIISFYLEFVVCNVIIRKRLAY